MEKHVLIKLPDGRYEIKRINIAERPYGFDNKMQNLAFITMPDGTILNQCLTLDRKRQLGNGGQGVVFSAIMDGNRPCAVKLLKAYFEHHLLNLWNNENHMERLEQHLNHNDLQAVLDAKEFLKHEIHCWLCLQLGTRMAWDIYQINVNVPIENWIQDIQDAQAVCKIDGHQFIHHILEFDLQMIPCIVSELCNGNLYTLCQDKYHFPFRLEQGKSPSVVWLQVMTSIAHGLRYMHSMNIAHGDIKPDNVLCKINGTQYHFYITDFGACSAADPFQECHTCTRFFSPVNIGTYHVPKQSDAYSFAVTGVYLLVCDIHETNNAAFRRLMNKTINIMGNLRGHFDVLNPLIEICYHQNTQMRYKIFQEWCQRYPVNSHFHMHSPHRPVMDANANANQMGNNGLHGDREHQGHHNKKNEYTPLRLLRDDHRVMPQNRHMHRDQQHAQHARRRQGGNGDCVCS